jgi:hypothetical protein
MARSSLSRSAVSRLPLSRSTVQRAEGMRVLDVQRLHRAAWAYTTRRVGPGVLGLTDEAVTPRAGDLVLARVDALGHHSGLQLADGRRRTLFVGDEIVVVYGNRYAPNQFEAVVPKTLGPCQLVAAGGMAAKALSWHTSITKPATRITPLGLLVGSGGRPVNLRDHALPSRDVLPPSLPPAIAVVGTAMDSGKTQTCGYLVRGLTTAGYRVGYAKITGTGAAGDPWFLRDAGADPVFDFTDAGWVSTYLVPPREVERSVVTLVGHLVESHVDAIVFEVADGVLQSETALLLASDVFQSVVSGVLFAASDAMGAVAGARSVSELGLPLIALSGVLTASPLQQREAEKATDLQVFSRQDLAREMTARRILNMAKRRPAIADRHVARNGDSQPAEMSIV